MAERGRSGPCLHTSQGWDSRLSREKSPRLPRETPAPGPRCPAAKYHATGPPSSSTLGRLPTRHPRHSRGDPNFASQRRSPALGVARPCLEASRVERGRRHPPKLWAKQTEGAGNRLGSAQHPKNLQRPRRPTRWPRAAGRLPASHPLGSLANRVSWPCDVPGTGHHPPPVPP